MSITTGYNVCVCLGKHAVEKEKSGNRKIKVKVKQNLQIKHILDGALGNRKRRRKSDTMISDVYKVCGWVCVALNITVTHRLKV